MTCVRLTENMSRIFHVGFQFELRAINKAFLTYAAFEPASDYSFLGCRRANSLTCAHRRVHDFACSAEIPRSDQHIEVATLVLDSGVDEIP